MAMSVYTKGTRTVRVRRKLEMTSCKVGKNRDAQKLAECVATFNFNLTTWMSSVQKGKEFRWIQLVSQCAKFKGVFIIIHNHTQEVINKIFVPHVLYDS
jgi:hypothetical protein